MADKKKTKKTYYRNGDVPRAQPTTTDNDVHAWEFDGKTIIAEKGSGSVELHERDEIVSTFTSAEAYKLGRHIYRGEGNKESSHSQWGKMLCSAAEHAALK